MKLWISLLAASLVGSAPTPPPSADAQDTIVTSVGPGEMSSTDTETTIVLHDQVVVTGTGMQINCDLLTIVALRQGDSAAMGQFKNYKSLVATGHVRLTQGDRIATCGLAEFFPAEDRIILSDHPELRFVGDKGGSVTSYQMILNRGQRNAQLVTAPGEGLRAVLPPIKDLGFGPGGNPAAPAAPTPAK